jgi:hypothetical protein
VVALLYALGCVSIFVPLATLWHIPGNAL